MSRTSALPSVALGVSVLLVAPCELRAQQRASTPAVTDTVTIAADVGRTTFSGTTDPWTQASVSIGKRVHAGSLIAHVHYARRYNTDGVQVELEAYPRLGAGRYLYLDAGHSSATVFPTWRYGAEFFTALPRAWEASVGVRSLHFGGAPVTLITGSVGRYVGAYWFSIRPYLHESDGSLSASGSLIVRKYRADADHWMGGSIGYGNSPSDRITPDAVARLNAFSAALNGTVGLAPRLLLTWNLGYDAEELSPGNTRRSTTLAAGVKRVF